MFGKSAFKIMDLMDKEELKNVGTPKKIKNKKKIKKIFRKVLVQKFLTVLEEMG